MEKTICISKRESAVTAQGKDYFKVYDTTGKMWCVFDDMCKKFMVERGAVMKIDYDDKGKFPNISKAEFVMVIPLPEIDSAEQLKVRSQCLSYSKDLAVAEITLKSLDKWSPTLEAVITKRADIFYGWIMGIKDE
jgi:hypothetical protein